MKIELITKILELLQKQIKTIQKKIANIAKAFSKPVDTIVNFIKINMAAVILRPIKREDYLSGFGRLLSKRLIFFSLLSGLVISIAANYIYSWAEGVLWIPTIQLNSQKFHEYSGEARVLDNADTIIYEGEIVNGMINGEGTQYDKYGDLHYSGSFSDNEYNGEGAIYSNGLLMYKGSFSLSKFEGRGTLYDTQGNIKYVGDFQNGFKNGKGTEYMEENIPVYEGDFLAGAYSGVGNLYQEGKVIYSGGFAEGKYNGAGILYNPKNEITIYKGEMYNGMRNGIGEEFDPQTGQLIYTGEFANDMKNGIGTLYDRFGLLSYSGEFHQDYISLKSYLGLAKEDIQASFGQATLDNDNLLLYKHRNFAFVINEGICKGVLIYPAEEVFGITLSMNQRQVHEVMGVPTFSVDYPISSVEAFQSLSIASQSDEKIYGDKYIIDNYYIKVLYSKDTDKVCGIEIRGI